MVRRTNRRKYRKRKRTGFTKQQVSSVKRIAIKAWTKEAEVKYLDNVIASSNVTNVATLGNVSAMAQGITDLTRIGDKAKMLSLRFSMTFRSIGAGLSQVIIRFLVFQWRENDFDVPPTVAIILQNQTNVNSMYNHDNGSRFRVLYDSKFTLDANGKSSMERDKILLNFEKKLRFSGGGVYANGNLYYLYLSNAVAATYPTVEGVFRLNYTDS